MHDGSQWGLWGFSLLELSYVVDEWAFWRITIGDLTVDWTVVDGTSKHKYYI